jgi:hypothetical protein
MADLRGKRYDDMSEKYQNRIPKEEFRARRKDQRMATDIMAQSGNNWRGLTPEQQAKYGDRAAFRRAGREADTELYDVNNLPDFNKRRSGAGGSMGRGHKVEDGEFIPGKAAPVVSRRDLKNLEREANRHEGWGEGMNKVERKQALIDWMEDDVTREGGEGTGRYGGKAAKMLEKWKGHVSNKLKQREENKAQQEVDNQPLDPGTPGKQPGVDETIADKTTPISMPGGNYEASITDLPITTGNIYGNDNHIGHIIRQSIYGGGGAPDDSALGLSQQYINNMEENYADTSGTRFAFGILDKLDARAKNNSGINSAAIYTNAARDAMNLFDMGNLNSELLFGRNRNEGGEWVMPGEPEDIDYEKEKKELQEVVA